jgi:hypothetical protein
MIRNATLSTDGLYRFTLSRTWDEDQMPLIFVMLNPSTADAMVDDPTIRRCISFAQREGKGGILVVNLFAYRATNPDYLLLAEDPFGPNLPFLTGVLQSEAPVVVGWGGNRLARDPGHALSVRAMELGKELLCLGTNKDGSPKHPLYLRADAPLTPWRPA